MLKYKIPQIVTLILDPLESVNQRNSGIKKRELLLCNSLILW